MRKTLSVLALTLLLAACNNSATVGSDVDVNPDGSMEVTTDEGHMTTSGSVPKNWPSDIPVYAGSSVTASADMNPANGKPGMMLMLQTSDDAETVTAFYKTKLATEGWKVEGAMNTGASTMIAAKKDGHTLGVSIAGSAGHTVITLGVETGSN